VLAAEYIADIMLKCLGRPLGQLRKELDHAKEKEAVNLLMILGEERAFRPDRGAHASWRYMNVLPLMHPIERSGHSTESIK
jgi:hypothetical protein